MRSCVFKSYFGINPNAINVLFLGTPSQEKLFFWIWVKWSSFIETSVYFSFIYATQKPVAKLLNMFCLIGVKTPNPALKLLFSYISCFLFHNVNNLNHINSFPGLNVGLYSEMTGLFWKKPQFWYLFDIYCWKTGVTWKIMTWRKNGASQAASQMDFQTQTQAFIKTLTSRAHNKVSSIIYYIEFCYSFQYAPVKITLVQWIFY